jgi:hypothetical protein
MFYVFTTQSGRMRVYHDAIDRIRTVRGIMLVVGINKFVAHSEVMKLEEAVSLSKSTGEK